MASVCLLPGQICYNNLLFHPSFLHPSGLLFLVSDNIFQIDVNFPLAPGFADPTQQAMVCAEGLLVPIPILDSLNTLWHFPISNSDPDTLKGKEERKSDMRRCCWAVSELD